MRADLGIKPQNVLIYATSNRRHLIREKFSDKRELDDDLHFNDTVQEKLSLVARFGVTIYYGSPDKKEFQKIVRFWRINTTWRCRRKNLFWRQISGS